MGVRSLCGTSTALPELAGRAELALADACRALELPQLFLSPGKLSLPSVSALGPKPAVLMLLLSGKGRAWGLGGLPSSWHYNAWCDGLSWE